MVSVPQRVLGDPIRQDASLENAEETSQAGGEVKVGWGAVVVPGLEVNAILRGLDSRWPSCWWFY